MQNSKISNQLDYQTQRNVIKESRTFEYTPFNISYINTLRTEEFGRQYNSEIKVNNFLCYQDGNQLMKVTEISYQDKIIKIQDKFHIFLKEREQREIKVEEQNKKQVKTTEKFRIFNKNSKKIIQKTQRAYKRDKKNIVKNLIKMFCGWIQVKKNQQSSQQYIFGQKQLKLLIEKQNYNNRLIRDIVQLKFLNKLFLQFLQNDAQQQIRQSRIKDKKSHYEAIQLYKKLIQRNQRKKGQRSDECSDQDQ